MPNLEEINTYKKTLVNAIINDRTCVDLITLTTTTTLPAKSLIDDEYAAHQIHLYDFIPDTVSEKRVHVCIEVLDGMVRTKNVRDFIIEIDVIVPEELMRMTGNVRSDALAVAIDKLINGSNAYGFGTVESLTGKYGIPVDGFRGRTLRYKISDWNNKGVKI